MSSSTWVQNFDLTLCAVQWYSVYVMLGVACQCHIRDFFDVRVATASSSALCLFCGLQAAWHPTSEAQIVSVCLCWLTTEKICSTWWIARTRVFPLFCHLSHPHREIPLVLFQFHILCVLRRRPWWGTPATPFLALHIRRKTPCLSDEGEFFWLCNELHIPNRRPGVAQLGPIKGWMKSWVASSCRLMDGIPSRVWSFFTSCATLHHTFCLKKQKMRHVNNPSISNRTGTGLCAGCPPIHTDKTSSVIFPPSHSFPVSPLL